jgi:hypothetical protein
VDLSLEAAERIEGCDFSRLTDQEISVLRMFEVDCSEILLKDTGVIFCCIWCCIQPQADQLGVDQMQFKEAVNGAVIAAGKEVWRNEALVDFFHDEKPALLTILEGEKAARQRASRELKTMAEMTVVQIDKNVNDRLELVRQDLLAGKMFG